MNSGEQLKWWVSVFSCASWQPLDPITAVFSVSGVVLNTDHKHFCKGPDFQRPRVGLMLGNAKVCTFETTGLNFHWIHPDVFDEWMNPGNWGMFKASARVWNSAIVNPIYNKILPRHCPFYPPDCHHKHSWWPPEKHWNNWATVWCDYAKLGKAKRVFMMCHCCLVFTWAVIFSYYSHILW